MNALLHRVGLGLAVVALSFAAFALAGCPDAASGGPSGDAAAPPVVSSADAAPPKDAAPPVVVDAAPATIAPSDASVVTPAPDAGRVSGRDPHTHG